MATWYTNTAYPQIFGNNYSGEPGAQQIDQLPNYSDIRAQERPTINAIYTWTGNEAQYDLLNIGLLPQGVLVDPTLASVASGPTAPATTLTIGIGDTDFGNIAGQTFLPNPQTLSSIPSGSTLSVTAPVWVSGTSYVAGNVVQDSAASPANATYTCIAAVSGSTAPHSDSTHWVANEVRYSASIDIHAASTKVAFAGGWALYGGPPPSVIAGTAATGYDTNDAANFPYFLRNDAWLQAVILTINTPVAGAVSFFRVPLTW